MLLRSLLTLVAVLTTLTSASAAPSLTATMVAPTNPMVYDMNRYKVVVKNVGTSNAQNVTVEFDLPETNTSPNVFLLGELGAIHRRCAVTGTSVVCTVGRVKPGKKKTRWIDVSFPVTTQTVVVFATVDSTNAATVTAWDKPYLGTWDTPISAPAAAHNEHCSGQGLTAFWECIVSPGSTSNHDIQFEANGSISFINPAFPVGYTGTWAQAANDHLTFTYMYNGNPVMTFRGFGTGANCFEGITTFANTTPYNAAYQVCL